MSILEKLSKVKKRWYVSVVLLIAIGAGGAYFWESRDHDSQSVRVNEQVFSDLVYLESDPGSKLTPEQAKEILPLASQLTSSQELKTQNDLEKQIYAALNPSQYSLLMKKDNDEKNVSNNRGYKEKDDRKGNEGHFTGNKHGNREELEGKGVMDPKKEALKDIVIKMLQLRSEEKAAS